MVAVNHTSLRRFSEIFSPPRKLSFNSAVLRTTSVLFYASCKKIGTEFVLVYPPSIAMLLIFFRLFSKLPLSVLHTLGAAAAWLVYWTASGYRQRQRENITRAGFAQHLSAAIAESGKSIMELPFIWGAPPEKVLASTRVENWEIVQQALDARQGVIFFTPTSRVL